MGHKPIQNVAILLVICIFCQSRVLSIFFYFIFPEMYCLGTQVLIKGRGRNWFDNRTSIVVASLPMSCLHHGLAIKILSRPTFILFTASASYKRAPPTTPTVESLQTTDVGLLPLFVPIRRIHPAIVVIRIDGTNMICVSVIATFIELII